MKRLLAILLSLFALQAFGASNILTWDEGVGGAPETGFSIERKAEACTGPAAFGALGTVTANILTFTDSTVAEGQTYCYRVRAAGPGGTFSGYSNTADRLVPFTVAPAPLNLQIKGGP